MQVLTGKVASGKNDASKWLTLFNKQYSDKLGMNIFPGSLNVQLEKPSHFNLINAEAAKNTNLVIVEEGEWPGLQRKIIMKPCEILGHPAFIWRTSNAERLDTHLVELITDVKLREKFGLSDGDTVEVHVKDPL